jgi:hypothetical protein
MIFLKPTSMASTGWRQSSGSVFRAATNPSWVLLHWYTAPKAPAPSFFVMSHFPLICCPAVKTTIKSSAILVVVVVAVGIDVDGVAVVGCP